MKEMIKDISPPSSRLQSALINTPLCKIILVSTYFPQDPRVDDFDETELILLLSEIRNMLNNKEFDEIIWTGDINADFMRGTRFVRIIDDFINEMNICKSWDKIYVDFTHANEYNGVTFTSTLDHFFWNKTFGDFVTDAGVLHLSDCLTTLQCIVNSKYLKFIIEQHPQVMHVQMRFHVGKRLLTLRSRITSMNFKLTCRISLFLPV